MLIVSIDEKEALTLYQSWWRYPEIMGIPKGSEEYRKLQKMWEEATGKKIQALEKLEQKELGANAPREEENDGKTEETEADQR